ncbi:unnamed protein product [Cylicocyclus nassatus]|uniref:Uncharacterized protein n=1 Tax=Cylicocyclus nassatus TaxID=53992 RepID=A0AA36GES7_CYLNA|nr:unnamed protein product [Cylicocyclus nassatus]
MRAVILFLNVFASTQAVVFDTDHETPDKRAIIEQYLECLKNCVKEPSGDYQVACGKCVALLPQIPKNPHETPDNRANLEQYVECLKNCVIGLPKYNQVACSDCDFLFSNGTALPPNSVNQLVPTHPRNPSNPGGPTYRPDYVNANGTYLQGSINPNGPANPPNCVNPDGSTYSRDFVNPNGPSYPQKF